MFDFHVPMNTYHIVSDDAIKRGDLNGKFEITSDANLKNLRNWLCQIKVETFFNNFVENGYHSLELLLIQMASK